MLVSSCCGTDYDLGENNNFICTHCNRDCEVVLESEFYGVEGDEGLE